MNACLKYNRNTHKHCHPSRSRETRVALGKLFLLRGGSAFESMPSNIRSPASQRQFFLIGHSFAAARGMTVHAARSSSYHVPHPLTRQVTRIAVSIERTSTQ